MKDLLTLPARAVKPREQGITHILDRGLSVAIGTEHGLEPLADCSVIVAPYPAKSAANHPHSQPASPQ